MDERDLASLHSNQRLLVEELEKRGVTVTILSHDMELLEATYNGHSEFLLDRDSSITPYPASVISGDKYLTKCLLNRAGLSVCAGRQFLPGETEDALVFAQEIGYPVVLKPSFGSHGDGVRMDLSNLVQVKEAIDSCDVPYLIEEQFEGKEYRVFITKTGDCAVLHRDCAHVYGDGHRTIKELAENETRRRTEPRITALCPLALDGETERFLKLQGYSMQSVPPTGSKVYLRHTSNVAKGGTCEDCTESVHPSLIQVARQALEVMHGMPYAGIDILSKDVRSMQTPDTYRILEMNSIPGIHMHMKPGSGKPRDVARMIADMIFPETKENGKP